LTSCRFIPALNEPNSLLSRLRLQEIGFGFRRAGESLRDEAAGCGLFWGTHPPGIADKGAGV
jgi:hypothetical protein